MRENDQLGSNRFIAAGASIFLSLTLLIMAGTDLKAAPASAQEHLPEKAKVVAAKFEIFKKSATPREVALKRKQVIDYLGSLLKKEASEANLEGALAVDRTLAAISEKEKKKKSGLPTTRTELANWLGGSEWKVINGLPGSFFFVDDRTLERREGSGKVAFSVPYSAEAEDHIKYATPKGDKRQIRFEEDFKSFDHLVEQNGNRFTAELMKKGRSGK